LSVCLFVCQSVRRRLSVTCLYGPIPISRTERSSKLKIGRIDANHTSTQWTYLEIKRSKVKVTRPINAVTESVSYLPIGKAYELQTWYKDGERGQASISREWKDPETSQLIGRVHTPRAIRHTSFKVNGLRSRSLGRLMLRPKVCHVFRTGRPINVKLDGQMEHWRPGDTWRIQDAILVPVHVMQCLYGLTINQFR